MQKLKPLNFHFALLFFCSFLFYFFALSPPFGWEVYVLDILKNWKIVDVVLNFI